MLGEKGPVGSWLEKTFGDNPESGRSDKTTDAEADKGITEGIDSEQGLMSRDEAYDILNKVKAEFRGNVIDIPTEQYEKFAQAATSYLKVTNRLEETTPGSKDNDPMVKLAQEIVDTESTMTQEA